MEITKFLILDSNKSIPANIWWQIENYGEYLGGNAIPFAVDHEQHIYYLKLVDNNAIQVWHLEFQDMEGVETYFVKNSFDELLESLYAE